MVFRDERLTCGNCGRVFFFTVTEQRRIAEQLGEGHVEPPAWCESCRRGVQHGDQLAETQQEERLHEPQRAAERPAQPVVQPRPADRPAPPAAHPRVAERPAPPAAHPRTAEVFPHEEGGVELKLIGTVKWFSPRKGYGFITKADGADLFFHRSEVDQRSGGLPEEGQQVEFQIRDTGKGPEAFNVSVLPGE